MAKSSSTRQPNWADKMEKSRDPQVSILDKDFSDMKAGEKMLIAGPKTIYEFLKTIPKGQSKTIKQLRMDLAKNYQADNTCPLTTGIFLRIVAEYAYEQIKNGVPPDEVAPFWRVIDSKSRLSRTLSFGYTMISEWRQREGIPRE
jgi:alkylated DNA nucleotide flippase Atl1